MLKSQEGYQGVRGPQARKSPNIFHLKSSQPANLDSAEGRENFVKKLNKMHISSIINQYSLIRIYSSNDTNKRIKTN